MAKRVRTYRFELPYEVEAPLLTSPDAGIDRIRLRDQKDGGARTLTLLDTADERLGRAGVLLAQEFAGDTGHWLLRAPDWQPWLPAERGGPLEAGDALPDDLVALLQPFQRRAALGPVGAVGVERAVFVLLDPDGAELAELLDDRVTVRRSGLPVTRRREVSLVPGRPMSSLQRGLVIEGLNQAGGKQVSTFSDVTDRLAALVHPASVPATPPDPAELGLEAYLRWFFSSRLHRVLRADLQVRAGQVGDTTLLIGELVELADLVRGLDGFVEADWAAELRWQIARLAARGASATIDELGEVYLDVLDALDSAARTPRPCVPRSDTRTVEEAAAASARELFGRGAATRVAGLIEAIDSLDVQSPDAAWDQSAELAGALVCLVNVAEPVLGKAKDRRRRAVRLLGTIGGATSQIREPDADALAQMTAAEAYQLGRDHQRGLDEVLPQRARLLSTWPRTRDKLLEDWPAVGADEGAMEVARSRRAALPVGEAEDADNV